MYPTKKLWDICNIERWWSPRPIKSFLTNDVNWVNWIKIWDTKNISKYIESTEEKIKPEWVKKSRMVYPWDFILSNSMSFWRPYIMKTTWCIHDWWLVLRTNKNIINDDLLYLLLNSDFMYLKFSNATSWTTVKNLSIDKVKNISIPLPPLPTQKIIVQKLDSSFEKIDKSIELTKKNLENIEELNKSVLNNFWDFKKVLIWDIVEELFAWWDLPKDWRYSKEKTDEYNIPIFANAIKEDWLYWYTEKPRVIKPAVTISARWTIWFTKLRIEPFYPIVRLLVLIPKKELADLKYLEYILNTINLKQFWSSIPQLSVPQLKSFEIPLPPLEKQKEIVAQLDKVFEKNKALKESYEKKLKDLEEMKQSLLKEAFEWRLVKE